MYSIDRIFEMLYRDNDEETQRLGIEEAKKIKYLSVLIQPIESESIWENCAKVLADKSDAELCPYLPSLLEWTKLLCLPGAQLIYDRLTEVSKKDMEFPLSICLSLAEQRGDKLWKDALLNFKNNSKAYGKSEFASSQKHSGENILPLSSENCRKTIRKTADKRIQQEQDAIQAQTLSAVQNKKESSFMSDIDRIFEMLYWDNDEETQRLGIEEAKRIKYLSVLIQPIESKSIWENCAKVLADKSDAELCPYLPNLLEWLQDLNWPGAQLIYDRLTELSKKDIKNPLSECLSLAEARGDKPWEEALLDFKGDSKAYGKSEFASS